MRRTLFLAAIMTAIAAAFMVGSLGASAAGPYTYGCGPLNFINQAGVNTVQVSIYNGSATTANLTHKILAGDGTQLQSGLMVPATSTLAATKTKTLTWNETMGNPSETSSTVASTVRVVSDVPVQVSVFIGGMVGAAVPCSQLVP